MEVLFEVVKVFVPIIITGLVTYWVTKYNKCPIDKIAISYNRIYYPLLKIIRSSKNNIDYKIILEETKERLQKYDKYASRTTIAACKLLEENIHNKNVKTCYRLLEDDIYKYNSKFRRRLGYPEPIFFSTFKFLSRYNKWLCVLYVGVCIFFGSIYIFSFLGKVTIIGGISVSFALLSVIVIIISACALAYYNVKYKIQKILNHIKK